MKNILRYKEYVGSVEISEAEGFLYGRILGIQEKITYQAVRADELVENFHQAVDQYLEECRTSGVSPEIPYKGSFNIRIAPALHRALAVHAVQTGVNLNRLVENILTAYEPLYSSELEGIHVLEKIRDRQRTATTR